MLRCQRRLRKKNEGLLNYLSVPDNDAIKKLHKFIKEHMVSLCANFSLQHYAFLRNLAVRLTLYRASGRRSCEDGDH